MNWRKHTLFLAIAALLCVGCGRDRSANPTAQPFRVGVILPLTGALAEMGSYERSAMEIAVADVRSDQWQLTFEDSRSTAQGAVTAANKLVNADKVQLLVTSTTGASLAVQPIAEAAGLPLVAFCMDPTITDKHQSTVRFYIGIDEETTQLTNYLATLPRTERVAILHAAVPVWRKVVESTYRPKLTETLTVPPLIEEYNLQDKDFRATLGRIAAHGATTLVLLGYGFEYPPIFQQLEQLGLRSRIERILGGWGFLYSSLSGKQLEGVLVAGPRYVFQRSAAADAFSQRFEAATKRKANFDAAFAYELVSTLPTLRSKNHLDAATIKAGLYGLGERTGIVGMYHFSERGDMIVQTGLGQYRDGVLLPYPVR